MSTGDNQSWDWSYTLIPKPLLTPQVLVGLGIGRDPLSAVNMNENGNPIWVTTVGNGQSNATVYVDYNGDNAGPYTDPNGHHYDTNVVARELQPLKIYDPDGDQNRHADLHGYEKISMGWFRIVSALALEFVFVSRRRHPKNETCHGSASQ